jgi:hypothetical protein
VDIVPELGGRIISIHDKAGRAEMFRQPDPGDDGYPRSGGYEEYSRPHYRGPGWRERYDYKVEEPGRRVSMSALLKNGLTLQRTIEASEDGSVAIRSVLINTSNEQQTTRVRIHPEFFLGPIDQVEVSYRTQAGRQRSISLRPRAKGDEWERTLSGDAMPAGQWAAVNLKKGWGVRQGFDAAQVDQCLLNWHRDGRINLELFSPEKTLAPGESITISHRLAGARTQ